MHKEFEHEQNVRLQKLREDELIKIKMQIDIKIMKEKDQLKNKFIEKHQIGTRNSIKQIKEYESTIPTLFKRKETLNF